MQQNHCLALNNKGEVFSWGLGLQGALGYELDNLEACQLHPKRVKVDTGDDGPVVKIFTGP